MGWIVVHKETQRLVFATAANELQGIQVIYPPASFAYEEWGVPGRVIAEPWRFGRTASGLAQVAASDGDLRIREAAERASLVVLLNRAVAAQRRLVDLAPADRPTYAQKLREAIDVANDIDGSAPLLEAEAVAQGVSKNVLASTLLMQHKQRDAIKLETQEFREQTLFQILHYPLHELKRVRDRLNDYLHNA